MLFSVTVIYEDGTQEKFVTDRFDTEGEIRHELLENPSPTIMIPSTSGGYLLDRQKAIDRVVIRSQTLGGHVMSEETITPESEAIEPEVMEEEASSGVVVYGEVGSTFQSFREKFVQGVQQQGSWMNQIVEKMAERNQLLQKAYSRLDEETKKLKEFVDLKVGE